MRRYTMHIKSKCVFDKKKQGCTYWAIECMKGWFALQKKKKKGHLADEYMVAHWRIVEGLCLLSHPSALWCLTNK